MAKNKPVVSTQSYGIYDNWDPDSKRLPRVVEFTTDVEAQVGIEFGLVVNIKKAKNQQVEYCINHPGILDDQGHTRPPFDGTVYVKSNDWDFYLGDTIWLPLEDKLGTWRMTVSMADQVVAEKSFTVHPPPPG